MAEFRQKWREHDAEHTVRFYARCCDEAWCYQINPEEDHPPTGPDWRSLEEVKRELKAMSAEC